VLQIVTTTEEVMYLSDSMCVQFSSVQYEYLHSAVKQDVVCVSVCLRPKYPENLDKRILVKFCQEEEHCPGSNCLDFGGDPDYFVDPGSFSRILYH